VEAWVSRRCSIFHTVSYNLSIISVDKVIIDQDSFGRFVNDTSPGAYTSMTQVNFAQLDRIHVRPTGIYGSQTELVNFLLSVDAIDTTT
jgi:hypothetical protein